MNIHECYFEESTVDSTGKPLPEGHIRLVFLAPISGVVALFSNADEEFIDLGTFDSEDKAALWFIEQMRTLAKNRGF